MCMLLRSYVRLWYPNAMQYLHTVQWVVRLYVSS